MTYGARLKIAMDRQKVSVSSLAQGIKLSYQAVKRVLDGNSKAFTAENNVKAADYLGVSSDWLATGRGPIDVTACANGRDANVRTHSLADSPLELAALSAANTVFEVDVVDEAMVPEFKVRDRVRVDPTATAGPGSYVVAVAGGQLLLRKLRVLSLSNEGPAACELVPLNQDFPIVPSAQVPIKLLGVVVEQRRFFR